MKILYLTFYFEPDLCAGSFRNTSLAKELSGLMDADDEIHIVTTIPNRYNSYSAEFAKHEKIGNMVIDRVNIPSHKSGLIDQSNSFRVFFFQALNLVKGKNYDLVFASSSRLFTAFLGSFLSRRLKIPLFLDIRDIFVDSMKELLNGKIYKLPSLFILKIIERFTFKQAKHINLISEGFKPYFEKYQNKNFTYFSNGIDRVFLNLASNNLSNSDKMIITYAGNIGEGQGLHKIIPEAAKKLEHSYEFRIIGDGGKRKELAALLKDKKVKNVELYKPVPRKELIQHYQNSHFLFLHLNDYDAFKKVLPSKVFEYGAFDVPIIAGVSGYASDFIQNNLSNYIVFSPGNVKELIEKLTEFDYKREERTNFKTKFSRKTLNAKLAKTILSYQ